MDMKDLNTLRSIDELDAYLKELADRIVELASPARSAELTDEERGEIVECRDAAKAAKARRDEMQARLDLVKEYGGDERSTENPQRDLSRRRGGDSVRGEDIYDLSTVRFAADPEAETRDRAKRAIDRARDLEPEQKEHLERVVEGLGPAAARRILATGSDRYRRAFIKYVSGQMLTSDEQRALSIYGSSEDGTEGNLAVPFTIDPTLIAIGDVSLNPIRANARIVQITGNTWKGVAADAVTASYAAEGDPATDGSPTFSQPTANVEEARAFMPYSIGIGQDYSGMLADLGVLIGEAKDVLEGEKFLKGAGHGSEEPEGILSGLGGGQSVPASTSFTVDDLYALAGALPRRYKARAKYMANEVILNLVRGFATAGTNIWAESLQDDQPSRLLGKSVYQCDEMDDTFASGKKVVLLGDFNRFAVVDRIGLNVELIPHLFDTSTGFPTGTRGVFAYWRNTSVVLDANAFRILAYGS